LTKNAAIENFVFTENMGVKMRIGVVLLTLCLLQGWLFAGTLAPATAFLGGVLRDAAGQPCASQRLELWQEKNLIAETDSDASGAYLFSKLPAGKYNLKIESAAFARELLLKTARLSIQNLFIEPNTGLKPAEHPWEIAPGSTFIQRPIPSAGPYVSPQLPPFRNEDFLPALPNSFVSIWKYSGIPIPFSQSSASYNTLKKLLVLNRLPAPGSIRLEEYYNAFPYDFPTPEKDEIFKATVEVATNPWNPERDLMLVNIKAEALKDIQRQPVNLVFMINGSGSMATIHKIDYIKESLRRLSNQLLPEDRISIIRYGARATLILDSCKGHETAKILEAIERLKASGEGNFDPALNLAYVVASKNTIKDAPSYIIHLSDGGAKSQRGDKELENYLKGYAERGFSFHSVGFGKSEYDESSMRKLAKYGKGTYHFIESQLSADKALFSFVDSEKALLARGFSLLMAISPEDYKAFRYLGFANDFASVAEELEYPTIDLYNKDSYLVFFELIPSNSTEIIEDLKAYNPALYDGDARNGFWIRYQKTGNSEYTTKWLDFRRAMQKAEEASGSFRWAAAALGLGLYLKEDAFSKELKMENIIRLGESVLHENQAAYKLEFLNYCKQIEKLKPY